MYLYIDESGDLSVNGTEYLIIAAILIDDYKHFDRLIKNVRRHKFQKELQGVQEIKGYKSSPDLVKHILSKLNDLDAHCYVIPLEKKQLYSSYLQEDKHKLYNYVAGKLASEMIVWRKDLIVRIDRSKGKQALRDDFDQYFEKNLRFNSWLGVCKIHHSWSHSWSGLQIADIVAWSFFQKFERNNPEYTDLMSFPVELYQVWKKTAPQDTGNAHLR